MDFVLTTEQAALNDSVQRFGRERYTFDVYRAQAANPSSQKHWSEFAELGWLGAGLSEDEGGYGGSPIEAALVAEGFGRALVVEPYISTCILSVRTLVALGGERCAEVVAETVSGERTLAPAFFEPDGRGDPAFVATRAAADGKGGYRLSGHKSLVIGGADADHLLVTARAEGSERAEGGVTLLFVPKDAPGLRRQDYRLIDRRPVSDIWLDDVLVGADAVLSAPGDALPAVMTGLDHAVVALCADSVGAMDAALWMTRDYLRTRHQFGQPLANFQALQHRMADMLIETELARSMVYQSLHALTCEPDKRAKGASAAKVAVAKAGLFVGQQAIQLHGGMGMTEEYAVGHYYKRLFVNASLFGNIDFHARRFAG